MPRPGVTTQVLDDFAPAGPVTNTGTGFVVGVTERGPANTPTLITSWRQFKDTFGGAGSDLFKAAYAFFNEGGLFLWVVRAVASDAVAATGTATGWLDFTAISPGAWGNAVSVAVDPQGIAVDPEVVKYVVTVSDNGVAKERSLPLPAEEVPGFKSSYVMIEETDTPTPPAGDAPTLNVDLSSGADGATLGTAELGASLDTLRYDLGPGQVSIPGNSDPEVHALLDAHCDKYHRVALADLPDTGDPLDLTAAVEAIALLDGKGRQILSLGHRVSYPGEVAPAVWDVPYSGVQLGIIARTDGLNDPSQVAAGAVGYSRLALAPKRDFTDDERETLNYQGVTLAKMVNNQFRTYGYRTTAGQAETNWVFFQESRVVMGIAHECDALMEDFVFQTIDGRGKIFGRINVALTGVCQRYWTANALFGDTPNEAFVVDTSYPGINTVETVAAGEIHAQVRIKTSRVAEWIALDIVKTPLERALTA